jgi:hypothetical protein
MNIVKYILPLIGLLCASASCLNAQSTPLWQDLGLYGGQIYRIAIDPSDSAYLYAGSWNGDGFFASEDGGQTWLVGAENAGWFRNLEVYDIDIDPNDPATIWVANNHYLDVSYDFGFTWKTFFFADDEGRFCYTVKVDPHDKTGNTVYAGTGGPDGSDELGVLYKTIDGGDTWFKMENTFPPDYQPFNIWDIDVNPAVSDEIWVTSRKAGLSPDGRIFMTMDGGSQWWAWKAALWNDGKYYPFSFLDEILVHPQLPNLIFSADGYGVLRKQDGTNTATGWEWVTYTTGSRALCIAPGSPYPVYAGFVDSVAKSTDYGETWDYYDRSGEFLCLAANPDNPDILFGGDLNHGVFKSLDGARTWEPKNTGIKANQVFATDVSPLNTNTRAAGTLAGIYRQIAGAQWTLINDSIAYTVRFHPARENTIFAGFDWELGRSTDNGATWTYTDVSDKPDGHKVTSIAIAKNYPDTIFAGISFSSGKRGELIKSLNAGTTYDLIWETPVRVNAVAVHPANPQVVFAGTGNFYAPVSPGNVYKSTNGGGTMASATSLDLVVNSIAVSAENPDIVYIGCGASNNSYAGIYKSTNAGMTWEEKTAGLPKSADGKSAFAVTSVKIDAANPDIVYAALFRNGIYVSLDGGNYWTCAGLSDYMIFDVNSIPVAARAAGRLLQKDSTQNIPSSTIVAGTASGILSCLSSGTGLLTGTITAQDSGDTIDNAAVSASCGSSCASSDGFYLLMMPAGAYDVAIEAEGYSSQHHEITVTAGEIVTRDIVLSQGGGGDGGCAATELLKNSAGRKHLPVLRAFRDTVLKKSPLGSRLTALYYAAEGDARKVLKRNPQLRARAVALLLHAMPAVLASCAAQSVSIPAGLLNEVSCFLFDLEQASPAELKARIHAFRREMKEERFLRFAHLR